MINLVAGERFRLPDEPKLWRVAAGKVEVYAVTRKNISFRQIFLTELSTGEAAFPPLDEFGEIDFLLYGAEDTSLEEIPFDNMTAEELHPLMKVWFSHLLLLSWVRLMADRGDEILKTWSDGSVLSGKEHNHGELIEDFEENESIFSMLLGTRFQAQDELLSQRMERRAQKERRIVDETIADLLDEEVVPEAEESGSVKFETAVFLVRAAAKALGMSAADIHIAPEMVQRLDQLSLIRRLTKKGGMELRLVKLQKDWHTGDSGVMIGYYGDKAEPVLLKPVTPESYLLVTRENPGGIPVTEEVAARLSQDAMLFYAGLPARVLSRLDLFKFMLRQNWRTDAKTIVAVSLLAGLIPIITPIITETMFSDIIPILDRKGLATVTQVAMVAGFTTAALTAVRSVAILRFAQKGSMAAEAAMLSRLLSLPVGFFRKLSSGEMVARVTGLSLIQTFLTGETVGVIFSFLCSFWSLGLMCWYSLKLTAVAVAVWLVYLLLSFLILSKLVRAERLKTTATNQTSGILAQIFTGLVKFRVKGAESQAYRLWGRKFAEEWRANYAARWQKNYGTILAAVQPILLALLVYYVALKELAAGSGSTAAGAAASLFAADEPMTVAKFLAFQSAYTAFNTSLAAVIPVIEQMSVILPLLENLKPILETAPESGEEKVEADVLSGALEVKNLTFAYREDTPNVLNDVSFRIAAGEHVAIVGRSGCGKSTLIRLLLGFESPKSGAVYYDGQDLSELDLPSVRCQLGVVLQNGQLMTGDIFHNIIGTNDLTLDDAWAAAEAAGVADDIREMPMQMNTVVSEGSTNISGGQRQRILIARALAMKPAIIICDEATSALDNRTQAIVTKSLDRLKTTRIVVAHRLSTIRHADRIIVLEGGRIAESGTFEELTAKGGLFASFVKRQVA
ncbi:NHLP bacteriocin export ABC transporter permease/ATPase subunit [Selenomonas sp. AB3002]|uniref:NHLP bacteriocin export ABC transporter permease/ATPase subunit n=1 Tax=Selenomonas sp. AB3002 TaxID=1392502 RepID=UPI000691EFE5